MNDSNTSINFDENDKHKLNELVTNCTDFEIINNDVTHLYLTLLGTNKLNNERFIVKIKKLDFNKDNILLNLKNELNLKEAVLNFKNDIFFKFSFNLASESNVYKKYFLNLVYS